MIRIAQDIKALHPKLKVGVNFLGWKAERALEESLAAGLDATWTDSPEVDSSGCCAPADSIAKTLDQNPGHLFFGSVAFKYQPDEPNPPLAALNAAKLGMIPTTSGSATGSPPSANKLSSMKSALGTGPLAAASGIDPSNVGVLGAHLTHILVSTGISSSFHSFDQDLLASLMANLPAIRAQ